MTVSQLAEVLHLEILNLSRPDREIRGGYAGDLLSWVMGKAKEDQLWATIMTNINVLAVASLLDLSCVVLTEGAQLPDGFVEKAKEQEINLLRTAEDTYSFCCRTAQLGL